MVEFALVAPILLLILFAIIDFSRAMNYLNDETNLANVGARYATVIGDQTSNPTCANCPSPPTGCTPGNASLTMYAYLQCQAQIDSSVLANGMTVCITDSTTNDSYAAGDALQVSIAYPYKFIPIVSSATKTLTSSATMMLEAAASSSTWITNSNTASNTANPTGTQCST
jgi:Flp pilus assembly protein TadG